MCADQSIDCRSKSGGRSGGVIGAPVVASQTRATPPSSIVRMCRALEPKATLRTVLLWLKGGVSAWPVATSQTRAEWSPLPVSNRVPVGDPDDKRRSGDARHLG